MRLGGVQRAVRRSFGEGGSQGATKARPGKRAHDQASAVFLPKTIKGLTCLTSQNTCREHRPDVFVPQSLHDHTAAQLFHRLAGPGTAEERLERHRTSRDDLPLSRTAVRTESRMAVRAKSKKATTTYGSESAGT